MAYGNVSPQSLRAFIGADFTPYVDVFLVFPQEYRSTALERYDDIKEDIKHLRDNIGISLWQYPKSKKYIKCVGGCFSKLFPEHNTILNTRGIGTFQILKTAHPIFLLQFSLLNP